LKKTITNKQTRKIGTLFNVQEVSEPEDKGPAAVMSQKANSDYEQAAAPEEFNLDDKKSYVVSSDSKPVKGKVTKA
jgi:hypothetical protein